MQDVDIMADGPVISLKSNNLFTAAINHKLVVNSVKKLLGHMANSSVFKSLGGGPTDPGGSQGPYLAHHRLNLRGKLPATDDVPSDFGTHDVNDEMLAEEYRRGMRVRFGGRSQKRFLNFFIS